MRILLSGGGTGGHVNPALAVADEIKKKEPDSEIAFVGTGKGIESKLVPKAGYKLYTYEVQGLSRSLSPDNIRRVFLAARAERKAVSIIKEFKPDVVFGTGGYACWPLLRAAASKNIPTALHESNAVPGFAVKTLEGRVDKIYVNFESTLSELSRPEKGKRVGNPLRGVFSSENKEEARKKLGLDGKYEKFILSCGGSMGAERINFEVIDLMKNYTAKHPEIFHLHASGSIEKDIAREAFEKAGLDKVPNVSLVEYIYDMPDRMAAADLIINRAGAVTLSEIALLGKASILIPSPNVTNNHQYKNARILADGGAATLIEEKVLYGAALENAVEEIIEDDVRRAKMEENAKKYAIDNAAEIIYNELCELIKEKKGEPSA